MYVFSAADFKRGLQGKIPPLAAARPAPSSRIHQAKSYPANRAFLVTRHLKRKSAAHLIS